MVKEQPTTLPAVPEHANPGWFSGPAAAIYSRLPGSRVTKVVYGGSALGLIVSVAVHAVLVVAASLVVLGGGVLGRASGSRGEVTLTPVSDVEMRTIETAPLVTDAPAVPDWKLGEIPEGPGLEGPSGDELPGAGSGDIGEIAESLRGTGGGLDDGTGLGAGGSGGGGASFFGVEARGSRFAYIVDVSGSMQGEKLDRLKVELIESLQSLLDHMNFGVICFSSEPVPLGGRTRWTDADDDGKKWAIDKVKELVSQGGTVPGPAFEVAFRMSPRPDAIYFMTDGQFDPEVADLIASLNRSGKKVPIHCITFVDRSSEEFMRKIAKDSGGTYTHIEGPQK